MTTSSGGDRGHDAGTGITAIMTGAVADVRLPDGLLDRAVARNRKRAARSRLIGAVSTVAAAAVAVGVVASLTAAPAVPGQAAPGQAARQRPATAAPRMETAAYVLARASAARLNSRKLISVTNDAGTMYTDIATQQTRYVAGIRAKDGQPYFELADTVRNGVWTETMVVNQGRVYSVISAKADGMQIVPFLPLQGQSDPMAAFYTALKQHQIRVVGHRTLNGRDTILLRVIRNESCRQKPGIKSGGAVKCVNGRLVFHPAPPDDEVWIDARTYLVVQTKDYRVNFKPAKPGYRPVWRSFITTVSWLAPTKENLARLSVTPPAGYAKVPYSEMVTYLGPIS